VSARSSRSWIFIAGRAASRVPDGDGTTSLPETGRPQRVLGVTLTRRGGGGAPPRRSRRRARVTRTEVTSRLVHQISRRILPSTPPAACAAAMMRSWAMARRAGLDRVSRSRPWAWARRPLGAAPLGGGAGSGARWAHRDGDAACARAAAMEMPRLGAPRARVRARREGEACSARRRWRVLRHHGPGLGLGGVMGFGRRRLVGLGGARPLVVLLLLVDDGDEWLRWPRPGIRGMPSAAPAWRRCSERAQLCQRMA